MSATLKGGTKLAPYLLELAAKANRTGTLKVGFLPGDTYPDGTPVATVAIKNNFGYPAQNIPARPFFSNVVRANRNAWSRRFQLYIRNSDFNVYDALQQLGGEIVKEIQESILTFEGVPLKPRTIRKKGHDKQLIETRRMLESVAFSIGDGSED
jgi:hypothetical protein